MASSSVIAKRYFDALTQRDLDAAVACWKPGGVERLIGQAELIAPEGIRDYFAELFDAFPDFSFELIDTTTQRERCSVRWRATGTFVGPGRFQGFAPNGARIAIEGCDVRRGRRRSDRRQHRLRGQRRRRASARLPAAGRLQGRAPADDAREHPHARPQRSTAPSPRRSQPASGCCVAACPRTMNVYLIEDEGGVTVFDAGIAQMTRRDPRRRGALRRHPPGRPRPRRLRPSRRRRWARRAVYCHPLERSAAQSPSPYRDYWNLSLLQRWARPSTPRLLASWDGGAARDRRHARGGR